MAGVNLFGMTEVGVILAQSHQRPGHVARIVSPISVKSHGLLKLLGCPPVRRLILPFMCLALSKGRGLAFNIIHYSAIGVFLTLPSFLVLPSHTVFTSETLHMCFL